MTKKADNNFKFFFFNSQFLYVLKTLKQEGGVYFISSESLVIMFYQTKCKKYLYFRLALFSQTFLSRKNRNELINPWIYQIKPNNTQIIFSILGTKTNKFLIKEKVLERYSGAKMSENIIPLGCTERFNELEAGVVYSCINQCKAAEDSSVFASLIDPITNRHLFN